MQLQDLLDMPEMVDLPERFQKFVICYVQNGGNATEAAIAAGYAKSSAGQQGYVLKLRDDIGSAILAVGRALVRTGGFLGVWVMDEIARDPGHKDRFAAAKTLCAINGIVAQQQVNIKVEKVMNPAEKIEMLKAIALKLGQDPTAFLEKMIGPNRLQIIDAHFSEPAKVVDEDNPDGY